MPKLSKPFVETVQRLLKARKLNQKDLANNLGVKPSLISRLLASDANPKLETIEAIADALGVPPWELLRPEGASPTPQVREHTLADCKRAVDAALERQIAADAEKRREADATAKEPEKEKEK